MVSSERRTTDVLGIPIAAANFQSALTWVSEQLNEHRKGYICFVSVHGLMQAFQEERFALCYRDASLLLPDGAPVAWVGRAQGEHQMHRVAGPEFMLEVFGDARFEHATHFLYGGEAGVAELLRDRLSKRFPKTKIIGTYTPPFRDLNADEEDEFTGLVERLNPDIIWVGIGCPKQELFMQRFLPRLQTTLMFGVGAAFDFHTGRIQDSPALVKRMGLQWLHRLIQDPRRLWRRYLVSNSSFLWHLAIEKWRLRRMPLAICPASPQPVSKVSSTFGRRAIKRKLG